MYLDPQQQQPQPMLGSSSINSYNSSSSAGLGNNNVITARIFVTTTEHHGHSSATCYYQEDYPPRNSLIASYNQAAFFAMSKLQADDDTDNDDDSSLSSSSSSSSVPAALESVSPNSSDDTSTSCSRKRAKRNVHFNETVTTFESSLSSSSNTYDDDVAADTIWYTLDDYKRFRAHHKVIARFIQGLYHSSCSDKDQIFYDMIHTNAITTIGGMTTETNVATRSNGNTDNDEMFCLRGLENKINTNYRKQSHQRKHNVMTAVLAEQERQFLFTAADGTIPNDILIRNESIQYSTTAQEIAYNLAKKDEEIAFQLFQ